MGVVDNKKRLQTRVRKISPFQWDSNNQNFKRKYQYFTAGGKRIVKQKCDRACSQNRDKSRFLQYVFSSSKEKRTNETCHKSETPQQLSPKATLQNGLYDKCIKSSQSGRLGHFSRSERCVSSCTSLSRSQTISEVLYKRASLPVPVPPFRADFSATCVYENSSSRGSPFTYTKPQVSSISRRLVSTKFVKKVASVRSRESPYPINRIRFHNKSKEVPISSYTTDNLHRGPLRLPKRDSMPNFRESTENQKCSSELNERSNYSQGLFTSIGVNGFLHSDNSQCEAIHASNSAPSTSFLETSLEGTRFPGPIYTTSTRSFEMVVASSQHFERQIFASMVKDNYIEHGCIDERVGCEHTKSNSSGILVKYRKTASYQLPRTESCTPCNTEISSHVEKPKSSCSERQYYCRPIHTQTRGDPFSTALLSNLGPVELCNSTQYRAESSSYCGEIECSTRPSQSVENQTNRMDYERLCSETNIQYLGDPIHRFVRINPQLQDTDVLHVDTTSKCIRDRCILSTVGGDVCLRLSPDLPHTQGHSIHEAISLPNNTDSSTMAETAVVYTSVANVNSKTTETSTNTKIVTSTNVSNLSPKPRSVSSNCMDAVNRLFRKKGFSKKSRNLLTASWRNGTQKDYSSKFKKFSSWCSRREIDTYTASLAQCADFLTSLFHDGLQYRTIAGYRSMLSAVLPPIDNIQVGQHPYIIRLLKGVFNLRPPRVNLLPEWDLPKVLNMLQKYPFEPLRKTSLKYVTYKTVFLIAITTFRRCGDIQSLQLGEGTVSVQSRGVTFVRQGLSKQDRPGHVGSKIFIPCFEDNKLLDPKRALTLYLKKTEEFRNKDGKDITGLFLSLNQPHNVVSKQTISKWITGVIRMAYEDPKKKVKAHSTRAIGPSWALYNGASMDSVLNAADWSRESTFVKFYLRNVDNTVLGKHKNK